MRLRGDFRGLHDQQFIPVNLPGPPDPEEERGMIGRAVQVYDDTMSCWGRVIDTVASDVVEVRLWLDTWRLKTRR